MGNLMQALGTMIIGMGIVFVVLVLICLIIYCFNIIPYFQRKYEAKKARKNDVYESQPKTAVTGIPVEMDGISGVEIAVIAAAIEAYTGMNQSDFIVRRIVRK